MPDFVRLIAAGRKPHAPDKTPVYRTMGYTLNISVRFLAAGLLGRGSSRYADVLLDWWANKILVAGGAGLSVAGREHFVAGQPYVVMSNHGSLLDIPALFVATPASLRMVLKQELTRVPVWGRALVASGFVPVDRGDRQKAITQLEEAKAQLSRGICIWIAPEGTRSRDGALGPFKKGGFHLAIDFGVPIIPCWIEGTRTMLPPDSFVANYNMDSTVRFGPPISTAGRSKDNIAQLMDDVRAAMQALA